MNKISLRQYNVVDCPLCWNNGAGNDDEETKRMLFKEWKTAFSRGVQSHVNNPAACKSDGITTDTALIPVQRENTAA